MGLFAEQVLLEYPHIVKRNTRTKEVRYLIRFVKRISPLTGFSDIVFEVRAHVTTELSSRLTQEGIYLTHREFDYLYEIMTKIRQENKFDQLKEELIHGVNQSRIGSKNPISNKKKV